MSKPVKNSQRGIILWHCLTLSGLRRLLQTKPALSWSRLGRILTLPFSGAMNSLLGGIESIVYSSKVRQTQIEHPPVFVVGHWRSGTTMLQTLLSHDPNLQHLSLYRTMFPWHFLLTERLVTAWTGGILPSYRPFDNVPVSWDSPQEEDFALCVMSQVSPLMITSNPNDLNRFWESLDFSRLPPSRLQRWKDCYQFLLQKMTFADSRRAVLKSPSHIFHVSALRELFPNAKFIHIHRNPYHVFRSTLHLRRVGIEQNSLSSVQFDEELHTADVIKSERVAFESFLRDRDDIEPGNLFELSYEELVQDPCGVLRRAYEELGFDFSGLEKALKPKLDSLRKYKKNDFDDDPEMVSRVYSELKPLFDHYGYENPTTSATGDEGDSSTRPFIKKPQFATERQRIRDVG